MELRLLSVKALQARLGISKATIYRLLKRASPRSPSAAPAGSPGPKSKPTSTTQPVGGTLRWRPARASRFRLLKTSLSPRL